MSHFLCQCLEYNNRPKLHIVLLQAEEDDDYFIALNTNEITDVKKISNFPLNSQPILPAVHLMSTTIGIRHMPEQRIFTVEGADG